MPASITIATAIATFAHGYAYTRSRTHPYLPERCGPLWVLRDGPRRRGDYRREEWIAFAEPPAEVDDTVRANARGRFALCVIQAGDGPYAALRDAYKALGYRLGVTEPFMVHDLTELPGFVPPAPITIERVATADLAERLRKAAGRTQIAAHEFGDEGPLRVWVALDGEQPVGWVSSIQVAGGYTWCANMYVLPEHRRRGVARALLSTMLANDGDRGSRGAVLLASHTGAKLYPVVGYQQIGTLLGFGPAKAG